MKSNKKTIVMKILKKHPEKRYSLKQLNERIEDISYPTLIKCIDILHAEGMIEMEDYGNVKLVRVNDS